MGILLLVSAIGMYFFVEEVKEQRASRGVDFESLIDFCNAGWGDTFHLTGDCIKIQLLYYSPWLSGIGGIVFLAKAGPYRGYQGAGGVGSHNRRMHPKTKRRLKILVIVFVVIAVSFVFYSNYEITVGGQNIDDIIPPEYFDEIAENMPVKIKERQ